MNLKELVDRNAQNFDEVFARLVILYPDQEENRARYAKAFSNLVNVPQNEVVKNSDKMQVVIEWFFDEDFGEHFFDVSGYHEGDSQTYALEFRPWREWLGYEVGKAVEAWGEVDTLAHILWEMTFVDFDEENIQNRYQKVVNAMEEYEREHGIAN